MNATNAGHVAPTARAQATAHRVHGVSPSGPVRPVYAGLVTRTIAFAIDAAVVNAVAVIVGGVIALVFSLLPDSRPDSGALGLIAGIAFGIWIVSYFVGFWTATGQTPGNRVMRIRVVRCNGSRLRVRHALLRLVGIVLSVPLLAGFIPILFTERRRGLPDWMAGTVVRVTQTAGG